jgi:hypothetical protein
MISPLHESIKSGLGAWNAGYAWSRADCTRRKFEIDLVLEEQDDFASPGVFFELFQQSRQRFDRWLTTGSSGGGNAHPRPSFVGIVSAELHSLDR